MKKIFVFLILSLFLISFVSAELKATDSIKAYDSKTQTITLINKTDLTKNIATLKLKTPQNLIITNLGYNKVAEFEINSFIEQNNIFESVKSYNLKDNGKEINIKYDYKILINKSLEYEDLKGVKHTSFYEDWEDFDLTKKNLYSLKGEKKIISLWVNVKDGDFIDWIPNLYGKEINEWATYEGVGGTITTDGLFTIHTFTSNGTFNWTGGSVNACILVVGGGGAGGGAYYNHGGGGAGGLIYNCSYNLTQGFYNITIGSGGAGGTKTSANGMFGGNGTNSIIQHPNSANTLIAFGGGGGGNYSTTGKGWDGGSGGGNGGASNKGITGGLGVLGQGKNGSGQGTNQGGAGGGAGTNAYNSSGAITSGGNGTAVNITNGTGIYYSGGGGGGSGTTTISYGGLGGGGNGGSTNVDDRAGKSAVANTGGGGGGCAEPVGVTGGNGGSGIIIIRYLTGDARTPPRVTLNSPENYFNTSISQITFNITALDYNAGGGISNVSLFIDGTLDTLNTTGVNGTYIFNKVLSSGLHNWSILAYNKNSSLNQSETRFINLTIQSPMINLIYPNAFFNTTNPIINFTANVTDNLKVQNVTLYIDGVLNETLINNTNPYQIIFSHTSEDGYYQVSEQQKTGQTFTTPNSYTIIKTIIYRTIGQVDGYLNLTIKETDGSGNPIGEFIFTDIEVTQSIPQNETIPANYTILKPNTEYILIFEGTDNAKNTNIYYDSGGTFINGERRTSLDGGVTWTSNTGEDLYFSITLINISNINSYLVDDYYIFKKTLNEGLHYWSILSYDNDSNPSQSLNRYLTIDTTPFIQFVTPTNPNNSNLTINYILMNASFIHYSTYKNTTITLCWTGGCIDLERDSGTANFEYYNYSSLPDDDYFYNITTCNIRNRCNTTETRKAIIDRTRPRITISTPTPSLYYYTNYAIVNSTSALINWTAYDVHLDKCFLTNITSGVNITGTCNQMNNTFYIPYGTYTFRTYANDTFGWYNSSSVTAYYNYKVFEINQSYTSPTIEGNTENYYGNIYLDSHYGITNVLFNYNGTNYTAGYTQIGNYIRLHKTNFQVPAVTSNVNNTFNFWVIFSDSSVVNLSTKTQQVNNLEIGSCGTYNHTFFYINLTDEKTQKAINGTIETNIQIKSQDGTLSLYSWTSSITNTTTSLCSSTPLTSSVYYSVYGTIKYFASNENYSAMTEYYNFLNFSLNSLTQYQNITLYDINTTEGTEFQLTFKDSSYRTREDILIYVYREYVPEGIFKLVELPKTDTNGQTIVHLVRNDVLYNLIAVDSSGNVLGTLNNVIAFCQDFSIGNCFINFQGTTTQTNLTDFWSDVGIRYSLSFDNSTNLISLTFNSLTINSKDVRMEVISSAIVTNRTLCNTSLNAVTGTLTCDVSSIVNTTASVNVRIFVDNVQKLQDSLSFDSSSHSTGGLIFFGFLLLLAIGIFFMESKEGVIIGVIIGFISLMALGVVKGQIVKTGVTSAIIWLIVVGIILLIKLNGERQ